MCGGGGAWSGDECDEGWRGDEEGDEREEREVVPRPLFEERGSEDGVVRDTRFYREVEDVLREY